MDECVLSGSAHGSCVLRQAGMVTEGNTGIAAKYPGDRGIEKDPDVVFKQKWICLEVMAKMNDIGDTNGEQAYWLDGKLSRTADGTITSYLGKGFPSLGTWTFDKFKPAVAEHGITWDYQKGQGGHVTRARMTPIMALLSH